MIAVGGLGSGLDVDGLVSQLVAAERAGSDLQLSRKKANLSVQVSALGNFKSSISTFQTTLYGLNSLSNYGQNTSSSSDNSSIEIKAGENALPNNYAVDVTQLATSNAMASTAFADKDITALGTGTLTIRFGTTDYDSGSDTYTSFSLNPESSVATIDIDSSNNTLEGIMNEINESDIGVNASIINDGTGYRLLMTSEATGEENSIEVSVTDDDGNNIDAAAGLSRFAFNSAATNLIETAKAQDAEFTVNGLTINSASNTVDFAIDDVSLTLKEAGMGTVDLSIKADTDSVVTAVNSFVAGYNKMITTVNEYSKFDEKTGVGGVLMSDFTVRSITGQVSGILRNAIDGLTGDFTSASELGITTTSSGTLELDTDKFKSVLASNPDDIKQIFAAFGTPDDNDVSFDKSSDKTATGLYNVDVSVLASSGSFSGSANLPDFGGGGTIEIDSDNDNFTIEVNGVNSGEITLTAGTYTSGENLAAELQAQINGANSLRNNDVSVNVEYDSGNNNFIITNNTLGSTSSVNLLAVDTNSLLELGLDAVAGIKGTDVQGTIGGNSATGIGNILTADSGSDAEGLQLLIDGMTLGSRGSVNFTRGLASQIDLLFEKILDNEGALEIRLDSIQDKIEAVEERKSELEVRWETIEDRYRRQFNALDIMLANFESTGTYLSQQFENLVKPNTRGG